MYPETDSCVVNKSYEEAVRLENSRGLESWSGTVCVSLATELSQSPTCIPVTRGFINHQAKSHVIKRSDNQASTTDWFVPSQNNTGPTVISQAHNQSSVPPAKQSGAKLPAMC